MSKVIYEAERKGFGNKPSQWARLTLEKYQETHYLQWGLYYEGATEATSKVSIRAAEVEGLITALQNSKVKDGQLQGHLENQEYAATLDWSVAVPGRSYVYVAADGLPKPVA